MIANSTHGLRRTNDDKRRAVLTLLEDDEWGKWSDREIARRCAVDHKTVARIRAEHLGNSPDSTSRTVERGGTVYRQNTANIGTGSKPDQDPDRTEPQENNGIAPAVELTPTSGSRIHPESEADDAETVEARKGLSALARQ